MIKKYEFQFSRNAERDFVSLDKVIQKRILEKLEFFENADDSMKYSKKLSGFDDKYSFRVGDYRIIVSPQDKTTLVVLVILKIGHRREVYE